MATAVAIEPQYVFGAVTLAGTCARKLSQNTTPTDDYAGDHPAEKNEEIRSQGQFVS